MKTPSIMAVLGRLACLLLFAVGGMAATGATVEQRLRIHLGQNYDSSSLPPGGVTTVSLNIMVKRVNLLEAEEAMEVDAWVMTQWNDFRLMWSEITASHVPKLTYSPDKIWHPDIALTNSLEPSKIGQYPDTLLLVLPSGDVSHMYPAKLRFPCVGDLTLWPRDTHRCTADFGSWVHDRDALDLSVNDQEVTLEFPPSPSGVEGNHTQSWQVLSTSLILHYETDPCCEEQYPEIKFTVTVMRSDPSVAYTVQIPLIALSLLTGMVFLLPPAAVEKVVMGTLCLVLDMQFLAYSSSIVPHSPSHSPCIIQLVSGQLVLTVAVVMASVLVVRLSRTPRPCTLPAPARKIVAGLAAACCVKSYAAEAPSPSPECLKLNDLEGGGIVGAGATSSSAATRGLATSKVGDDTKDNILLGAIIDRFCLAVYFIIVLVTIIVQRDVLF